uniref:KsgA methyltransferase (kasugamycin sensitivity) n=1 Tax=Escherichia coli TaxID=562 RepID=Q47335_ECOLX|nr:unnamed protein product [Escherichia coli]
MSAVLLRRLISPSK